MNFQEALTAANNLGETIETQYGQWGHFTQESADTIVDTVQREYAGALNVYKEKPSDFSAFPMFCSMFAVTWMNESTFATTPKPNENKARWNPWNFDVGPLQLNVQWTMRMAWQRDFKSEDLPWQEVFGEAFYEPDGVTPCAFKGNLVTHCRAAFRRLLAVKAPPQQGVFPTKEAMQVVSYTGPKAQSHRSKDWTKFGPLFEQFFSDYTKETT